MSHPRAAAAAIVLALALPAGPALAAPAAPDRGATTIALDAGALRSAGVTVAATAPARMSARRVTLPVSDGEVGAAASIDHAGGLRLRAGARSVALTSVQVRLGTRSTVSALVRGRRVTLFALSAPRGRIVLDRDALSARVTGARLALTTAGAGALRAALGARDLRATTLGTVTVDADLAVPPIAERPRGAVDITGATIDWHPRESFVQYIHSGGTTSVARGAFAAAPTVRPGSDAALVYDFGFGFAPRSGWFDPATGRALVSFHGTVRFAYPGHGILIDAKDPEIELDGPRSRAIFRLAGTGAHDRRAVLTNLDPAPATATVSPDGRTHALEQVPASIPRAAGASIFAGFYLAGDPFGWLSVSFTTR